MSPATNHLDDAVEYAQSLASVLDVICGHFPRSARLMQMRHDATVLLSQVREVRDDYNAKVSR